MIAKKTIIGEHKNYISCRFCFSENLTPILQLGNVPLAGGFLISKSQIETEKVYPLVVSFCNNCFLLQSINVINADILFKDYFYHSSAIKTLTDHFTQIADDLSHELKDKKNSLVLEIGANDGTLIKELIKKNVKVVGVDPATNIVTPLIKKGLPFVNDYFSERVAKEIKENYGQADVIFSSNTLAHIEDMHDIVSGIKIMLKRDGYLMFEVHYLGNLLTEMQYDMIYHEHQYYYSVLTLQKFFTMHNMEIFDVKPISIHAGSMRFYVQHKNTGRFTFTNTLKDFIKKEQELQFDNIKTYKNYSQNVAKTKSDLLHLLNSLKKDNKTIAGYGASGRGTTIMNYCGLDKTYLDYVIDDAPAKQGAFTPGTHLEIKSSEVLSERNRPDYVVLFAWSFVDEIKKKNKAFLESGGKFLVPLPNVRILS